MPRPTSEQLTKINRFAQVPLTEENCYVFPNLMIDNLPTAYSSKISPSLLGKFVQDAENGVPLMLSHDTRKLPVGRSFEASLRTEYDHEKGEILSVYGSFFMPLGIATEVSMSTDDLAKRIDSGVLTDTSIGFTAKKWDCSICGNDIRNYLVCPHVPGKKYMIERNGVNYEETCYVIVGADGNGELLENSLVYQGACDRASIKQNFSANVRENITGSKLHLVDDFKDIPVSATIYQYYTKDGSVLLTDTDERTGGAEYLRKKGVEDMELAQVKEVLQQFGIEFESVGDLSAKLTERNEATTTAEARINELETQLTAAVGAVEEVKAQLSVKDEIISELTKENERLSAEAGLAQNYRKDLMDKALELGVRANGNAFNTEVHTKLFSAMSVDELKEVIAAFDAQVKSKFEGSAIAGQDRSLGNRMSKNEPQSAEDFETEHEFRAYVAEKAVEYARENSVSISEATKLMMKKFSKGETK